MKWSFNLFLCNWIVVLVLIGNIFNYYRGCNGQYEASTWEGTWQISPTTDAAARSWNLNTKIPMISDREDDTDIEENTRKKGGFKVKKKYRKFLLPLLIAYKLKFFALLPVMIGMLLLLVGSTGLAGFFFALFAASMGLNKH